MIPRAALTLGLAGLLPIRLRAGPRSCRPRWQRRRSAPSAPRFAGQYVLVAYGTVILCFMSGVLWGFAAKGAEQNWTGYALSVAPALWAFFLRRRGRDPKPSPRF